MGGTKLGSSTLNRGAGTPARDHALEGGGPPSSSLRRRPPWQRYAEPQKLSHCPAAVCDPGGHRRGPSSQTVMPGTEVIHRAHQIHPAIQSFSLLPQSPSPAHQQGQPFPKSRVQPFDVSRDDPSAPLHLSDHHLHPCLRVLHDPLGHPHPPPLGILLDDFPDDQLRPRYQMRSAPLPRLLRLPKGPLNLFRVGRKPICADQQRRTLGSSLYLRQQVPHQRRAPLSLPPPPNHSHILTCMAVVRQPTPPYVFPLIRGERL